MARPDVLERIEERLAAAQDRPWRVSGASVWRPTAPSDPPDFSGRGVALATLFEADAAFIATARNLFPELLAVVRAAGDLPYQDKSPELMAALAAFRSRAEQEVPDHD